MTVLGFCGFGVDCFLRNLVAARCGTFSCCPVPTVVLIMYSIVIILLGEKGACCFAFLSSFVCSSS